MPSLAQNNTDCPRWSHYEGWCEGFDHDCDLETVGYVEPKCDRNTCSGRHISVGNFVESRAARDDCRGVVYRTWTQGAEMWCQGCDRPHVLQDPLHHFWNFIPRRDEA